MKEYITGSIESIKSLPIKHKILLVLLIPVFLFFIYGMFKTFTKEDKFIPDPNCHYSYKNFEIVEDYCN